MVPTQQMIKESNLSSSTYIVPREPEWKSFKRQIEVRRQTQQIPGSIINFVGTAGIGKTTLLRQILRYNLHIEYPDIPLAFVDFDKNLNAQSNNDSEKSEIKVLAEWITEIAEQTQTSFPEFSEAYEKFASYLSSLEGEENELDESKGLLNSYRNRVARTFVNYLKELLKEPAKRPIVLFMDTVEDAPKEVIGWLERAVLEPITASGWVVCVLASRQHVDWQSFEVRQRVIFQRLRTFDQGQVATQLSPNYSYLAPDIIKLSFGLPAATEALAEEIKEIEQTEQQSPDEALLQRYRERLVEERLLEKLLYKYLMSDVSEDLKEALLAISPLRHFTVNVTARILPKFAPTHLKVTSGIETLVVIRGMMETTLVDWDREKRGYAMEEPLRRIMALAFMVKDQTRFLAVHQEASELYSSWIDLDGRENCRDFIIEWIYHQAHVLHGQGESRIGDKLGKNLKKKIDKCYVCEGESDVSAIDALYNQMQSDTELQEELADIEETSFDTILSVVKTYHIQSTAYTRPRGES